MPTHLKKIPHCLQEICVMCECERDFLYILYQITQCSRRLRIHSKISVIIHPTQDYRELHYVNLAYFQSYPWLTMAACIDVAVHHQSTVQPISTELSRWGMGFQSWESRPRPQSSGCFSLSAHFLMDSFHSLFLFVEYSLCAGHSLLGIYLHGCRMTHRVSLALSFH